MRWYWDIMPTKVLHLYLFSFQGRIVFLKKKHLKPFLPAFNLSPPSLQTQCVVCFFKSRYKATREGVLAYIAFIYSIYSSHLIVQNQLRENHNWNIRISCRVSNNYCYCEIVPIMLIRNIGISKIIHVILSVA